MGRISRGSLPAAMSPVWLLDTAAAVSAVPGNVNVEQLERLVSEGALERIEGGPKVMRDGFRTYYKRNYNDSFDLFFVGDSGMMSVIFQGLDKKWYLIPVCDSEGNEYNPLPIRDIISLPTTSRPTKGANAPSATATRTPTRSPTHTQSPTPTNTCPPCPTQPPYDTPTPYDTPLPCNTPQPTYTPDVWYIVGMLDGHDGVSTGDAIRVFWKALGINTPAPTPPGNNYFDKRSTYKPGMNGHGGRGGRR